MDKTGRLMLFVAAVQAGSFSQAASNLQITRSVLSKQIAQLEQELGGRLINRTTRSFSLTEVGQLVYQEALKVRNTLDDIHHLVSTHREEVSGELKITATNHFGRSHLQYVIYQFMAKHAQIKVELQLTDSVVDIVKQGIDIAIRITEPQDSSLVARKLFDNQVVIVASAAYLERYGTPQTLAELPQHRCVVYGNETRRTTQWRYLENGEIKAITINPTFVVNDGNCMLDAVKAGVGIGMVARFVISNELETGEIVALLPDIPLPPYLALYAVYPARQHLPAKTRAFLDLLYQYVQQQQLC